MTIASAQQKINALSDVKDKYDLFIFDIWGVVHDGVKPYSHSAETLEKLRAAGKGIVFLSNAPRTPEFVADGLKKFGIEAPLDRIVSSGELSRAYLREHCGQGKKFYQIGREKNQDILTGLGVAPEDTLSEQCHFVLLTAFYDAHEDPTPYFNDMEEALALGLPLICTNPDVLVPHGDALRHCAGFFAKEYEKQGGEVIYFGKPHLPAYQHVFQKFLDIDRSRMLMIGDSVDMDILGANLAGIDSLLMMTGNGRRTMALHPEIVPTYIMDELRF